MGNQVLGVGNVGNHIPGWKILGMKHIPGMENRSRGWEVDPRDVKGKFQGSLQGKEGTWLLRGAADGEGVPLVGGDSWDIQVDVIPRLEAEGFRPLDHQVGHLQENGSRKTRSVQRDSSTTFCHGKCSGNSGFWLLFGLFPIPSKDWAQMMGFWENVPSSRSFCSVSFHLKTLGKRLGNKGILFPPAATSSFLCLFVPSFPESQEEVGQWDLGWWDE